MDYFATGAGVMVALLVVQAHDSPEAKQLFLDGQGYYGSIREYLGQGVQVSPDIDRPLLGRWLTPTFLSALEQGTYLHAQVMLR
jgi:hypothetical protein